MELSDWWPWYNRIAREFGYDRALDQQAADLLSNLIRGRSLESGSLSEIVRGADVLVFGAGPSLEDDLAAYLSSSAKYVAIAADGATSALVERGLRPRVIVTDLDGNVQDIMRAAEMGAKVVVHAHGDNTDLLKENVPRFRASVLGTTQVEPRDNVYNFGGFTDGDRCVFLAEALGAKRIVLAGMDFGRRSSGYSKPSYASGQPTEVKVRKLQFAKELIEWLAARTSCEVLNLTARGEPIRGVPKIAQL